MKIVKSTIPNSPRLSTNLMTIFKQNLCLIIQLHFLREITLKILKKVEFDEKDNKVHLYLIITIN